MHKAGIIARAIAAVLLTLALLWGVAGLGTSVTYNALFTLGLSGLALGFITDLLVLRYEPEHVVLAWIVPALATAFIVSLYLVLVLAGPF